MVTIFVSYLRNFYVSVRDDANVRSNLLCGEKSPFTILAGKLRIDYRSSRYTRSWQGFQARYVILNDSLPNGKDSRKRHNTLRLEIRHVSAVFSLIVSCVIRYSS